MKTSVQYLQTVYQPDAIVVFGSYADDSYTEASDFDALVICNNPPYRHDVTRVYGKQMDVLLYTAEEVDRQIDPQEFLYLFDAVILFDKDGIADRLVKQVQAYIKTIPYKELGELTAGIHWCEKTLERTECTDNVGMFRWHSLLVESLKVYCDIKQKRYFGPKKTLRMMEETDVESFLLYTHAVRYFEHKQLSNWIKHLRKIYNRVEKEHLRWMVKRK